MFQYACGRALSLKRNVPLALDLTFLSDRTPMPLLRPHFVFRNFDLDVFNIDAHIAEPSDIPWHARKFFSGKLSLVIDAILRKVPVLRGWEKSYRFSSKISSLVPNAYLSGFWQSEKYFSAAVDVIRKDFTLKNPLSERSQELFDEIRNTESLCMHVRRSDIAAKLFHGTVDADYYARGISCILKDRPIGKIYVFSDDMEWCKQNLQFPHPTMFVGPEYSGKKGEEHLLLMSACKNFVIPNSTFSWWAARLSNNPDKIVVAPKNFLGSKRINTQDLIPESWVRL